MKPKINDAMRAPAADTLPAERRSMHERRALFTRLTDVLESITDAFFTLDTQGCFTYVNRRAEEVLQASRTSLLGCNVWEKFPQPAGGIFQREYEQAVALQQPAEFEAYYEPLNVWLEVRAYPSKQGLTVYIHDTSARHAAEQRLLDEQQTLTALINSSTDAIISTDTSGNILLFNPMAERTFQYSQASMLGQNIQLLMPERYRAAHPHQQERFAQAREPSRMMGLRLIKGLRADGQEIDLEGIISQVTINQQHTLIASLRDVTERIRLDTERQAAGAQLTELNRKLMAQEKQLVKRIAQSLHDQLGQTLAAIRMVHETITMLQHDKSTPELSRLDGQLGNLIGQAIRQVRHALIDLHPPLLDEMGLAAALDNDLRNRAMVQPKTNIVLNVKPSVATLRWPAEVEYAAFMVAREAVDNALRHAQATRVTVMLSGSALLLQLDVIDTGHGFDSSAASPPGHLGIAGMHQRARQIGATLSITSGDNGGTHLSLSWQPAP